MIGAHTIGTDLGEIREAINVSPVVLSKAEDEELSTVFRPMDSVTYAGGNSVWEVALRALYAGVDRDGHVMNIGAWATRQVCLVLAGASEEAPLFPRDFWCSESAGWLRKCAASDSAWATARYKAFVGALLAAYWRRRKALADEKAKEMSRAERVASWTKMELQEQTRGWEGVRAGPTVVGFVGAVLVGCYYAFSAAASSGAGVGAPQIPPPWGTLLGEGFWWLGALLLLPGLIRICTEVRILALRSGEYLVYLGGVYRELLQDSLVVPADINPLEREAARLLALLRTSPAATTAPKGGEVSLVPEAGDLAEAVPAGALSVGDKVAREVTQNTQGE